MSEVNLAILGCGLVGKRHVESIKETDGINLTDIIEHDPTSLVGFNKSQDIKIHNNLEEYLIQNQPDGMIISTPTVMHLEQSLICLEKKIPLLIEKPIAINSLEASQIVKKSEETNTPVLIGQHRRHNNIAKIGKKIISDGTIGEVRSIQATCWFYKPDHYFNSAPWRKQKGAGPIYVNLIHDIDLLRYFCGDVKSVFAYGVPSKRGYENEDVASILLKFENDITATLSVSDSIVSPWSWEMTSKEHPIYHPVDNSCYLIGGSKGSLSLPDLSIWKHENQPDWWTPINRNSLSHDYIDPLIAQLQNFKDVITNNSEPLVTASEGAKSLKVIEAIHESISKNLMILIQNI